MTDGFVRFLVLGRTPEDAEVYPVSIGVHPAGVKTRVNLERGGPPMVSVGGQFPVLRLIEADGALTSGFTRDFANADALWLVPYLARLADGEEVTEAELVAAYVERYGVEPAVELARVVV